MITMSWKTNLVVGMTVLGGVIGVNQMLSVKTPDDVKHYQQEQQVEQGSDAVEMQNEHNQEKLPGGIDAESNRELTPNEVRPVEPDLKLKFRP